MDWGAAGRDTVLSLWSFGAKSEEVERLNETVVETTKHINSVMVEQDSQGVCVGSDPSRSWLSKVRSHGQLDWFRFPGRRCRQRSKLG